MDVRADGPAVVRKGPTHGPTVVVFDLLGDAKHDELPATWRALTEEMGVVWWRLPAAVRIGPVDDPLPVEPSDGVVHLVAAGDAAALAVALAEQRRDVVRSVVLVDAPWQPGDTTMVRDIVADIPVLHVRTTDRLPIGHPDVVAAVRDALASVDDR